MDRRPREPGADAAAEKSNRDYDLLGFDHRVETPFGADQVRDEEKGGRDRDVRSGVTSANVPDAEAVPFKNLRRP
jgi:hypothetical protein